MKYLRPYMSNHFYVLHTTTYQRIHTYLRMHMNDELYLQILQNRTSFFLFRISDPPEKQALDNYPTFSSLFFYK